MNQDYINRHIAMRNCFKKAKKLLRHTIYGNPNKHKFICHAIAATDCDEVAKADAKNLVMRALDGNMTFEDWYRDETGKDIYRGLRAQTLRHQWLDKLIQDCDKEILRLKKELDHA